MSKTSSSSFTKTIAEMNGGASIADLSAQLGEVIAAVRKTGKTGSLTYKLVIKPASVGDIVTVMLQDSISAKLPQACRPQAIFFTTEENELQRSDPRQSEMDLKVVKSVVQEAPRAAVSASAVPVAAGQ